MQENKKNAVTKSNTLRNISKSGAATVNKSAPVVKKGKKALSAKRASAMHAVRAPRIVNVKKKDKSPFPWAMVFVAILLTGMFLFMMMNYAEVDKTRSDINDLKNQLTAMEKTEAELKVELSNKYNIGEIEQYAREELGMTNIEGEYQIITPNQEDKTEMQTYDDGEEGGFGFLLTGLGEVIEGFINGNGD